MKRIQHQLLSLRFEYTLLAFVILSHLYLLLLPTKTMLNWYLTDDAFYYFQVARNISRGVGITFDGISQTSGFHPLWMLICIPIFALSSIDSILPLRVLIGVSALLTYSGGILIYRMVKEIQPRSLAVFGSLLWTLFWPVHRIVTQSGMETVLNGFLILLLVYTISKQKAGKGNSSRSLVFPGIVAALVILSRLDNIFLVFFLGLWMVFDQGQRRLLVFADILAVFFSVFVSYILRFGSAEAIQFVSTAFITILMGLFLRPCSNLLLGLYDNQTHHSIFRRLIQSFLSASVSLTVTFGFLSLFSKFRLISGFPRSVLIIDLVISTAILFLTRLSIATREKQATEPDSAFLSLWKVWLSRGLQFFLPVILLLSLYMSWNQFTFGTAIPVSGQIKQWWGSLPNTIYGRPPNDLWEVAGLDFDLCSTGISNVPWRIAGSTLFLPVNYLNGLLGRGNLINCGSSLQILMFIAYGGLIIWIAIKEKKTFTTGLNTFALPAFLCACFLQLFFYNANVYLHTRDWYWVSQILTSIFFVLILLACLYELVQKKEFLRNLFSIVLTLCILLVPITFLTNLLKVFPYKADISQQIDPTTFFLEENTEPGVLIGMTGGGITAFFISERTIVNLDGLMNSTEYFNLMQEGKAHLFYDRVGLDYVFGSEYVLLNSDPYQTFFEGRLIELQSTDDGTLFKYLPDHP